MLLITIALYRQIVNNTVIITTVKKRGKGNIIIILHLNNCIYYKLPW